MIPSVIVKFEEATHSAYLDFYPSMNAWFFPDDNEQNFINELNYILSKYIGLPMRPQIASIIEIELSNLIKNWCEKGELYGNYQSY